MIAFAIFTTLVGCCLCIIWLLSSKLDSHALLSDEIGTSIVLLILLTIAMGVVSATILNIETEPHYYPVIISVPVIAEKP